MNLNRNYRFICWSKYRIDSDLSENEIKNKFERRFGKTLDLSQHDLVLVNQAKEEEQQKEIVEVEQNENQEMA